MAHVILKVKDNKLSFFFEFIKNFNFIKVEKTITDEEPLKEDVLKGLNEAIEEMKLIRSGKKKQKNLKAFLDEL